MQKHRGHFTITLCCTITPSSNWFSITLLCFVSTIGSEPQKGQGFSSVIILTSRSDAHMVRDGLLQLLLADPDVPARDVRGGVLQKGLDQYDVMAARVVDVCCVPFAE